MGVVCGIVHFEHIFIYIVVFNNTVLCCVSFTLIFTQCFASERLNVQVISASSSYRVSAPVDLDDDPFGVATFAMPTEFVPHTGIISTQAAVPVVSVKSATAVSASPPSIIPAPTHDILVAVVEVRDSVAIVTESPTHKKLDCDPFLSDTDGDDPFGASSFAMPVMPTFSPDHVHSIGPDVSGTDANTGVLDEDIFGSPFEMSPMPALRPAAALVSKTVTSTSIKTTIEHVVVKHSAPVHVVSHFEV